MLTVAVGLAIPGILAPVTGALLHELSSIPVIMNPARLISFQITQQLANATESLERTHEQLRGG
jgi:cation transport ATPase